MYDTRNLDALAAALIDLTACINSPRQDEVLLNEAGIALDRALFPLLVRLSATKRMTVATLADQVGKDPSTVSRQVAKLEQLGLVKRPTAIDDRRAREAAVTKAGQRVVAAITAARRRLLHQLMNDWTAEERRQLPVLMQRLADTMKSRQAEARQRA